jgi:hypothetical protein
VPEATVVLEAAVVAVGEATADDEAIGAVVAAGEVGCWHRRPVAVPTWEAWEYGGRCC